ncbi:membrane protein of unknown function [Candidatus Nitrosocosmicus arcticus]|uniref:Uncharacterized protein n=1 Tax=Candidatus Nitrosocosmicus arcticus TaxID=2035267 RepID=A0A557SU32_9ARCH|nr:membrane protein of unknown function [Candidatus Nitrosocosmicus arcticus]
MISEYSILIQEIHLVTSILWWSVILIVITIIRPLNKGGNLSIILPQIRRLVIFASTISIVSGFVLFGFNSNFRFEDLAYTSKGNVILLSGSLSLIVYYHVLYGSKPSSMTSKLHKVLKLDKFIPNIMFGFLTAAMVSMILASVIIL